MGTTTDIAVAADPKLRFLLARADDCLVHGHRLSEWCGHAPLMEEDMALANIALDLIGQARALYSLAAETEGDGRTEDDYAYRRDAMHWRNLLLVEQSNGDFAKTILRLLLHAAFAEPYWRAMTGSADPALAGIAAKAATESAYHLRHAAEWTIRLGDGTEESHRRAQEALESLWILTGEMFEPDAGERAMVEAGIAIDPATLRDTWQATIDRVLDEATLAPPKVSRMLTGGRTGRHGEALGHLLAELQFLQRTYPGCAW